MGFLVKRYGDFILLKPPLKVGTVLLWGAPLLVLLAGGMAIVLAFRGAGNEVPRPTALTPAEAERLAALVGKDEG